MLYPAELRAPWRTNLTAGGIRPPFEASLRSSGSTPGSEPVPMSEEIVRRRHLETIATGLFIS